MNVGSDGLICQCIGRNGMSWWGWCKEGSNQPEHGVLISKGSVVWGQPAEEALRVIVRVSKGSAVMDQAAEEALKGMYSYQRDLLCVYKQQKRP